MAEKVEKPDEPKSTPEKEQVSTGDEPTTKTDDPSTEVQSEEMGGKLKKMESELGRFKQELGDERKKSEELNAYKVYYDQNPPKQQQEQLTPEEQAKQTNEQWFDNPAKMAQNSEAKMLYYMAQQNAPMALATAKTLNPDAFVGISDVEVQQGMQGGVQSGTTNPAMLADPNAYIGMAWILRGQKTGFKPLDAAPVGMSTTETETPGAPPSAPDKEIPPLEGDDLTEMLMSKRSEGVTKEKFLEKIQATREEEGR